MAEQNQKITDELESELGIYVDNTSVDLPSDRVASECLAQVADYLLQNGYIQVNELPIKSGHKRYILNTEPEHKDGNSMHRSKEVHAGVFIETNYDTKGIKRKILKLYRLATSD